jgi:predicted transposase/invertase (TIGR01784 family)
MNQSKFTSLSSLLMRPLPPGYETVTGPLPYNLLNDLMFRIVFEINPKALKALLCSLLHYREEDIAEIEIKNPINLGNRIDEKTCIFDINILLNNQKQIHLELQVLGQKFWTDRSLCYLCRNFGKINAGDDYQQIKHLIQIDILDFDLYENSKEFYSIYHLANDKSGRIYSDKIALHVLELNKEEYATEEDKAYHIDYWAKLFKATTWEELRMLAQEQQVLQSTVETIYRVNADDYVRAELEAREDGLRLQRTYDNEIKQQLKTIDEQQNTIDEQKNYIAELEAKLKQLQPD